MLSYPHTLTIPHAEIARIIKTRPIALILTRELRPGVTYQVHDQLIAGRNRRHLQEGRPDRQSESVAFPIEVSSVAPVRLGTLDLVQVRSAGHKTVQDFRGEWGQRYPAHGDDRLVFLTAYRIAEEVRFLHRQAYRGYTSVPAEGAFGEPEAISRPEQDEMSRLAFERDKLHRRQQSTVTPLSERVSRLEARARAGDDEAQRALFVIRRKTERAEERLSREAAA